MTGSGKTDLNGIFVQIESLVLSEYAAFHCALIGRIDTLIGGYSLLYVQYRRNIVSRQDAFFLHNDSVTMISVYYMYVDT